MAELDELSNTVMGFDILLAIIDNGPRYQEPPPPPAPPASPLHLCIEMNLLSNVRETSYGTNVSLAQRNIVVSPKNLKNGVTVSLKY